VDAPIPGCELETLDLADPEAVRSLILDFRPSAVIHAAAVANPEACEREPERAARVNVGGTEAVARACAEAGAHLIYLSTDLVYDGNQPPYREGDEPRPMNLYARTKLQGEDLVRSFCPGGWSLRFALGYGWKTAGKPAFTDNLYTSLSEGRRVKLFKDQIRTPTFLGDAVAMIRSLAERGVPEGGKGGVLHLSGPERISRLRFGEVFCEVFGFDPGLLEPVSMSEVPSPAYRPRDCSLDGSRLWALAGRAPLGVRQGLLALRAERGAK
jgi:dTDP-4-dehydrorhamnose reductase